MKASSGEDNSGIKESSFNLNTKKISLISFAKDSTIMVHVYNFTDLFPNKYRAIFDPDKKHH